MNRRMQNIKHRIKSAFLIGTASIFIASGTVDLVNDNYDDIYFNSKHTITQIDKERTDNYEVLQAIGKGVIGIVSIILNTLTKTTIVSKNENIYRLKTTCQIKLNQNKEIATWNDSLFSEYFTVHKDKLKVIVLSRLSPDLQEQLYINDIKFIKQKEELTVYMDSEVNIEDRDKGLIELLIDKLSEILETIVTEKINRIASYSIEEKVNLEKAIFNVFKKQIREINDKILPNSTYSEWIRINRQMDSLNN